MYFFVEVGVIGGGEDGDGEVFFGGFEVEGDGFDGEVFFWDGGVGGDFFEEEGFVLNFVGYFGGLFDVRGKGWVC